MSQDIQTQARQSIAVSHRQALPNLGVVIVNWNNPGDTLRCLEALEVARQQANYISLAQSDQANYRLVVVENGSLDDSRAQLQAAMKTYPHLELLESRANLGFTGGYNLGIRHLLEEKSTFSVDYLVLLNDDAVPDPTCLAEMAKAAREVPEAAFLGPKILCLEEPQHFLSAGGILKKDAQTCHRGLGELDCGQYDQLEQTDFLSGCALWVKRQAIDQVGLLDERFFAYYEDVDWCFRARQAGFSIFFAPRGRVWHPDTRQRDADSATVSYYLTRNSLLFAQKHHLGWLTLSRLLLTYTRTWLSWRIRPKWRHKAAQRQAMAQAVSDFFHHRYGERA